MFIMISSHGTHLLTVAAVACSLMLGVASPSRGGTLDDGAPTASFESRAIALKPGEFLWRDDGGAGAVTLVVSTPLQRLYAYRAERLIGVAAVSTGKAGHRTPHGDFTVLEKRVFHRSNLYSNAPMPHMQRLTWDGIALHAGHDPGYPASHGCIRLPPAFAALLFRHMSLGAPVAVVEDDVIAPPPPSERFVPRLPAVIELLQPTADGRVFAGARYADAAGILRMASGGEAEGRGSVPDAPLRPPTPR